MGSAICVVAAVVAAIVVRVDDPGQPVRVAAVSVAAPEVQATTTSSSTSTTSSTSSTSTTSTSTTVKPRPVVTTIKPVPTTVRTTPPPTAPPVTSATTTPEQRCATARQWVEAHGLVLPAGWGFRCPGEAVVAGTDRWGVACWNCVGPGSWIAVDVSLIGPSDAALRYVIAHETCHALDYTGLGITTEIGADLCAALHGAPRP
jgi:hypothetical protein